MLVRRKPVHHIDWKYWEVDESWNIERIDNSRKFETAEEAYCRRVVQLARQGGNPDLMRGFA
jgi:hypothetical protein